MKKIAIFADVQNVYYTCRDTYGRQFDYRALYERVAKRGKTQINVQSSKV